MCPEPEDSAKTVEPGKLRLLRLWVCVCPDDSGTLRIVAHRGRPLIAQTTEQVMMIRRMAQEIMNDRAVRVFIVEMEEVHIEEVPEGTRIHIGR